MAAVQVIIVCNANHFVSQLIIVSISSKSLKENLQFGGSGPCLSFLFSALGIFLLFFSVYFDDAIGLLSNRNLLRFESDFVLTTLVQLLLGGDREQMIYGSVGERRIEIYLFHFWNRDRAFYISIWKQLDFCAVNSLVVFGLQALSLLEHHGGVGFNGPFDLRRIVDNLFKFYFFLATIVFAFWFCLHCRIVSVFLSFRTLEAQNRRVTPRIAFLATVLVLCAVYRSLGQALLRTWLAMLLVQGQGVFWSILLHIMVEERWADSDVILLNRGRHIIIFARCSQWIQVLTLRSILTKKIAEVEWLFSDALLFVNFIKLKVESEFFAYVAVKWLQRAVKDVEFFVKELWHASYVALGLILTCGRDFIVWYFQAALSIVGNLPDLFHLAGQAYQIAVGLLWACPIGGAFIIARAELFAQKTTL